MSRSQPGALLAGASRRPAGPAQLRLAAAVADLLLAGNVTACRSNPDAWFDGTPSDRERAAAECVGCPVFAECGAAADEATERFGVWAGQDRGGPS